MKQLLCIALALLMPPTAAPQSSRLGSPDRSMPAAGPATVPAPVADVLICLDIDANYESFADPTPTYAEAFVAAGATVVATCAVESSGGTINFPGEVTADNYPVVVVLTSENWWSVPQNLDPQDEAVLADYLESGGNLLLVGQDYMYGAHPSMGPCSGFPRDYLGLEFCYQDVVWAPETATITGSSGWLFEGESYLLDSSEVFLNNPFFPDCADPAPTAGCAFGYDDAGRDGILIYNDAGTFKTIWSGIELAGASTEDFHEIIDRIYDWFLGITPVEESSWSDIKAMYRP